MGWDLAGWERMKRDALLQRNHFRHETYTAVRPLLRYQVYHFFLFCCCQCVKRVGPLLEGWPRTGTLVEGL